MDTFDIDADLFARVRRATGDDAFRFYLTGVFVEPDPAGGAYLIATDGAAMLVAHDKDAIAPRTAIIRITLPDPHNEACCDDCRGIGYSGARLVFSLSPPDPAVVRVSRNGVVVEIAAVEEVEAQYPDWRRVFGPAPRTDPPRKSHMAWGINPNLLARVSGGEYCTLAQRDDGGPATITFDGRHSIVGVVIQCDLNAITASRDLLARIGGGA